jgi:hypothetical protein
MKHEPFQTSQQQLVTRQVMMEHAALACSLVIGYRAGLGEIFNSAADPDEKNPEVLACQWSNSIPFN